METSWTSGFDLSADHIFDTISRTWAAKHFALSFIGLDKKSYEKGIAVERRAVQLLAAASYNVSRISSSVLKLLLLFGQPGLLCQKSV